jgi:Flp pilus assembly protein TadG
LELALIAPVLLALLALVVMGGRFAMASTAITGVAGAAARDASLARTPAAARAAATATALATLAAQNLHCQGAPTVAVDTSGFAAAPGTPASVSVDVTCEVVVNGLSVPGLPTTRTVHDRAVSPLDPYRSATSPTATRPTTTRPATTLPTTR